MTKEELLRKLKELPTNDHAEAGHIKIHWLLIKYIDELEQEIAELKEALSACNDED